MTPNEIDAAMSNARGLARKLNDVLDRLQQAGVETLVTDPWDEANKLYAPRRFSRVRLTITDQDPKVEQK